MKGLFDLPVSGLIRTKLCVRIKKVGGGGDYSQGQTHTEGAASGVTVVV